MHHTMDKDEIIIPFVWWLIAVIRILVFSTYVYLAFSHWLLSHSRLFALATFTFSHWRGENTRGEIARVRKGEVKFSFCRTLAFSPSVVSRFRHLAFSSFRIFVISHLVFSPCQCEIAGAKQRECEIFLGRKCEMREWQQSATIGSPFPDVHQLLFM